MHIGFVALTDAAPLIVADANGLFRQHGLDVQIHREIGWATVRDKVIYGELDAAHAPAPMLWSAHLGLHRPATDVLTAFVLNLNGNALTLSRALWDQGVRDDAALRELALERRRQQPLTFGVVFPFSSHHLLLRDWLLAAGLQPERDVRIVVVPPAQTVRNLAAGTLDGFCAGEPWNTLAVRDGVGWCRLCSALQTPRHIEKVLMVRRVFADLYPELHAALIRALAEACAWCDEPQNRAPLAELLQHRYYLNMPAAVIAPALVGHFDGGPGGPAHVPDFHIFHGGAANHPDLDRATALQNALIGSGLLSALGLPADLPRQLFRPDLYRHALAGTTRSLATL